MRRLTHQLGAIFTLCVALILFPAPASGQPSIPNDDKPLQIEGRLPQAAIVTTGADPVPADMAEVDMLRDQLGIVQSLDARAVSSINRLSRVSDKEPEPDTSPFHLHFLRGPDSGMLELFPQTETVLIRSQATPPVVWTIRREAFDRLGIDLTPTSSSSDALLATDSSLAMTLPVPHTESEVVLDRRTIRSRIKANYPSLTRTIGEETYHIRLPERYNPETPSGVLVWISPTPSGRIPEIFGPVCDTLGLVAIGVDNNGNKREITDRLQNHLDSIETLAQLARIDRDRIYLTGMSGGGRCSGILLLAFPDVFAGAVPIVGLDTYHNAPTGRQGQYWPQALGKPAGKWMNLLRDRRIRSITGSADFNEPEMSTRTRLLRDDGIQTEIDVIPGMAHTMPNAQQFQSALMWVDEPRRESKKKKIQEADDTLAELKGRDVSTPAIRRQLIEIMQKMPYSEQAWEAASRLGYPREQ